MVNVPRKTALFTLLAAAWLAAAVIFAGVFVIAEHDHEHVDAAGRPVPGSEGCQICLEIQIAVRIIEAFGCLGASLAIAGLILCAIAFGKPRRAFCLFNLAALKVKFNC